LARNLPVTTRSVKRRGAERQGIVALAPHFMAGQALLVR